MDSFEQELKAGFLDEASQLFADAEQCYLQLETNPKDISTLEKLFRIAHNLKGSSKAVGFDELSAFTHVFESFMLKCKSGQVAILPSTISLLLKCNDHVKQFVDLLKVDFTAKLDSQELVEEINNFKAVETPQEVAQEEVPDVLVKDEESLATSTAESNPKTDNEEEETFTASEIPPQSEGEDLISPSEVSLVNEKFEEELVAEPSQVEVPLKALAAEAASVTVSEMSLETKAPLATVIEIAPQMATKTAILKEVSTSAPILQPNDQAGQAVQSQKATPKATSNASENGSPKVPQNANEESIRVSISRLEKLLNFVGELVILQTVLKEQAYSPNPQIFRKTILQMGKVTKEVQDLSMSLRMVPLKQTFLKMQRIVRDVSGVLGKKVQLVLIGDETEVDKTVLESLSDPLVHLIRNAVDHGIEMPADRVAKGKSEIGIVTLQASHQSGKLVIEIRDNGGGIPAARLREKALEKGILKPGQTISDKEAIQLIFHPGFSTKAEVTEVSGRGVGMDVVKTNIEQMQGEVLVETVINEGSTFKVVLPLTLAIIDGMVVRCGEDRYVIPLAHVHESVKPEAQDLKFATGVGEILLLRGENLPVIRLSQALGKKKNPKIAASEQIAIIIRTQSKPFAALVDDVIGQHQVVIKKLGAEIQHIRGYSGSAILGDGRPALILELGDLLVTPPGAVSTISKRTAVA